MRTHLIVLLVALALPAAADEPKKLPPLSKVPKPKVTLTVDAAYKAIPHRRTVADLGKVAGLDPRSRQYLELMFATIEQAIRLRVATLKAYFAGTYGQQYFTDQDALIAFVTSLEPPAALKGYHAAILEALAAQRAFYADWKAKGKAFDVKGYGRHASVRASSAALRRAWSLLGKAVPPKDATNKNAYFDYHCALDFV